MAAHGRRDLRVLHLDDDPDQLHFAKIFLERCDPGIVVDSVTEPAKALAAAGRYDCVVSDYQMADLDGVSFTRKVRRGSDVPIIIYTGRGSEEVEDLARRAGADGYVQKEVDPRHYRGLYEQIVRAARARADAADQGNKKH